MDKQEIIQLSAIELGGLLRRREVSSVEVTRAHLDRIDSVDPKLNAFVTVLDDQALELSRRADRELGNGTIRSPLHGVPVAIKDQIHMSGVQTTGGSALWADFVPTEDATVVRNLKRAGAIIVGKTTMSELAFGNFATSASGMTRNPWDLTRTPGVSSSGSGAATAALMCPTSLGADTGGSIRNPSANCGLTGLRPSWGRVSRYGLIGASRFMDTIGPIARTAEDCAATMGVVAGHDPRDPYSWNTPVPDYLASLTGDAAGVRIGLVREMLDAEGSGASTEVLDGIASATRVLSGLGAEVSEVSLPLAKHAGFASHVIIAVECASLVSSWLRDQADDFDPYNRVQLLAAELLPASVYCTGQKLQSMIRAQTLNAFEEVDVLLTPTMAGTAAKIEANPSFDGEQEAASELMGDNLRALFSLVGGPALSICCGFVSHGGADLPLAMQIAGKPGDEAMVLRVADAYQRATAWHLRRPPI